MIFLHAFRVIWKQASRITDSPIFQKPCFYGQTPLGRWIFLHSYDIFFQDSCCFPYTKNFGKYQTILSKKIQDESTTLIVGGGGSLGTPYDLWNHSSYPYETLHSYCST